MRMQAIVVMVILWLQPVSINFMAYNSVAKVLQRRNLLISFGCACESILISTRRQVQGSISPTIRATALTLNVINIAG